ncbi:MAG: tRNA (N6-isopentenyl adenosine(37)-C2)-methylthiotransferase MiaB [Patescibacteria group bacterium]
MKVKSVIKYHLVILGCQMNKSDGERIRSVLDTLNFKEVEDKKKADLLIYVACSVRQSAINRVYGQSAQWGKLRKAKKLKTILTGCLTSFDQEKIAKRFDLILDIKDLANWPSKIGNLFEIEKSDLKCNSYLAVPAHYESEFSAYVPIMNGCNNFCSYCVVPYTRGREISRPVKEIITEIKKLVSEGYKEIILVGQNVNSYDGGVGFPKLLKMVNAIKGDFWIRFVTSHPKDMSAELIKTIGQSKKVCEYLHIAVQSGNNVILKKMNRKYTINHYKELIEKLRTEIKNTRHRILKQAMISTDIIVGFPSETKKQFDDTAKLMNEIKFDLAYIARYSPRPGTAAEKLKDNVSPLEKQRREYVLTQILKQTALENNQAYLDQIVEVLVEGKTKNNHKYLGKTRTFKNVSFASRKNLIGQFAKIKITQVGSWGISGDLI